MKALVSLGLLLSSASAFAGGPSESFEFPDHLQSFSGDIAFTEFVPPGMALQRMMILTSDRDQEVHFLHLMQKKDTLVPTGMFVEKRKSFLQMDDVDPSAQGKTFYLADIERPEGAAVFEASGRKVLILQGTLNRSNYEGRLKLKYLTNGLSMSYDSCDVLLRNTRGQYWAQNAYTGEKITSVKVITHFLGVDTLEGLCPAQSLVNNTPVQELPVPPMPVDESSNDPGNSPDDVDDL